MTTKSIITCLFTILISFNINKTTAQNKKIIKRELSFNSNGVMLFGTLYFPEEEKNLPAIVITHGAGREGRFLRAFQYQGDFFAKLGFATFAFDRRGVGESEGEYVEAGDLNIPAKDLIYAVEKVKSQPEVDSKRIGVIGVSQGGWVGPLAATLSKDISFVISLVGGGVSVRDQVLHHRKSEIISKGWPKTKIDSAVTFCKRLFEYYATGIGYDELKEDYRKASNKDWFSFITDQGFGYELKPPEKLTHPWYQSVKYDPKKTEENLNVPFLAIFGETDKVVPTDQAVQAMKTAFKKSGFKDYRIVVVPNIGHLPYKIENGNVQFRDSFKKPIVNFLSRFLKTKKE